MVQLGLMANFKHQALHLDGATVPMKEPIILIGKSDLNKRKMCEVVMQTAEPASTIEATDILVNIIDSAYENVDLKQGANNATQLNYENRTQLLRLLKYFKGLFDGTLGDWDTEPIHMELKPGCKPFNSKYYPVPIINKDAFCKEFKHLVKIVVLTLVQQSQYSIPVFVIPKKEGTMRFITYYLRLNHKLVRNTYQLSRIGDTMHQLELFQYETAFDINVV